MSYSDKIRNFCIIAHVDHGKSTLADRIIEHTKAVSSREMKAQILDSMDIERERGITIKSQAVKLSYQSKNGETYTFNLIDTPGHVDFNYEVSRSLAACEGAILVVDAAQGVEAQTISNFYFAFENNLEIVPVINKIDLPAANIELCKAQMEKEFGVNQNDIVLASAKNDIGIDEILEAVVKMIPPPKDNSNLQTRALIFDSYYDAFRGAVMIMRIFDGAIKKGDKILLMESKAVYEIEECGTLLLGLKPSNELKSGEVGYIIAGIKNISDIKIGDTITLDNNPSSEPLIGYKEVLPMVFAGIFPAEDEDYTNLQKALEKLKLNDASFIYEPERSIALGFGYRCGFLGLLHLEIVQERLEREFNLNLVITSPSVEVKLKLTNGEEKIIDNPADFPVAQYIEKCYEPFINALIIVPSDYLGNIISLCIDRRGVQTSLNYLDERRAEIKFDLPLIEVVYDFYDKLKSISRGYASFDYDFSDFRESQIEKIDILVHGEVVDALSFMSHRSNAETRGRQIIEKLKYLIPRHMFQIPLQAAIGGRIIARENISALRKNVTAKCYGGDITRKRKLLEKQKEGKKRMKSIGSVEIPQDAFISVLKTDDNMK